MPHAADPQQNCPEQPASPEIKRHWNEREDSKTRNRFVGARSQGEHDVSAVELAAGADLVVCEATFASADRDLARRYRHLTAADAGRVARDAGARRLVITHFSQRYPDARVLLDEAAAVFPDVVAAEDLARVAVPTRAR